MAIGDNCVDPLMLSGYAGNDLPVDDATHVEQHLRECGVCLAQFLKLDRQSPTMQIPDCRFVKEIGRGRFGVVYKAWWTRGRPRIVALKLLSCPSEMERSRFDREVAVLKKLDSPSIVKCLDSGTTGNAVYYVMDLVDGVHLDEYIKEPTRSLAEKLAVFADVCRAVASAHAMGVVHRDLKPRNILIDAEGKPHVLDFGICSVDRLEWSTAAQQTITHPGDLIGTLRYMSPEQAWGGAAGIIDERSDIWALGIMLYEIVTEGDYPYSLEPTPDKSIHEALLERIRKELPKLPKLAHLPRGKDLETLVSRCVAWEVDRRLDSAAELSDDLERYVDGQRIRIKPPGIAYRIKRLAVGAAARSRWTFAAVLVAAIGLSLWVSAWCLDMGWRVPGNNYQSGYATFDIGGSVGPARESIIVAAISDDSALAVKGFALKQSIEGVTANVTTWRGVHAYLMERLASAGPRGIAWDFYFRTPQAADERLVKGIRTLENAGTPVVLAALTFDERGAPDLSPGITRPLGRSLRYGAIVARDMVKRQGEFVTALRRADEIVVPSLALSTLAAMLHAQTRLDLAWQGRNRWMEALYELEPGAYLRERDRIEFTKVYKQPHSDPVARTGDMLGINMFELEPPDRWDARTVPYEELLTCSDKRLQNLVANKLIVVGDLRYPRFGFRGDRHRVKYGSKTIDQVPGCYLLADAIAGLLDRRYFKAAFPLETATFAYLMLLAVIGCLLPIRLAATKAFDWPAARRVAWAMSSVMTACSFVVMVVSDHAVAVHAGMAGFALGAAMTGSFGVEFTRNRHRITDRNRRSLESLQLSAGGTVTLPLKRPMPLPAPE